MKVVVVIVMFLILLTAFIGFTVAANEDAGNAEVTAVTTNQENTEDEQIVGASCGTVTPGYEDECCLNKGYEGWDPESFTCIGEKVRTTEETRDQIQAAKATNAQLRERENLTPEQIQKLTQLRNRLLIRAQMNASECPDDCTCTGSSIKCSFENGTRVMTITAGKSGNTIVQVKNVNMSTNVTLYRSEDGKFVAVFKNNKTKVIILPDEVRERIQEKLNEKEQNRNRTRVNWTDENITLDEDGYYHVESRKRARLFLIVPVKEKLRAQVDPETGEVIKIRKTWWGFLARDVRKNSA